METYFSFRLGGWLLGYYGPIHLLFEANSQAPNGHLTIAQAKRLGALASQAAAESLADLEPRLSHDTVQPTRDADLARWQQFGSRTIASEGAIRSEYKCLMLSRPSPLGLTDPFMTE
jgi:hypothetical protein